MHPKPSDDPEELADLDDLLQVAFTLGPRHIAEAGFTNSIFLIKQTHRETMKSNRFNGLYKVTIGGVDYIGKVDAVIESTKGIRLKLKYKNGTLPSTCLPSTANPLRKRSSFQKRLPGLTKRWAFSLSG
ncbi:hypothetical protein Hypma_008934 [Hypsizygus marmoreus]|uniref:Uncharacterized protein n=1 Tax=Hypsizygus marmoreus TaxID=39966 RepID=A0A369JPY5_HYPMA|nr:hypothetical protein Hypma_008934 [Hypsizygus marmoreus]